MRASYDPRHKKRRTIIKEIFAWQYSDQNPLSKDSQEVADNLEKIDQLLTEAAPDRPLKQINRIDLAILRLAIFELFIKPSAPYKVVVDEAVELAKEFGADSSASFINGALGKLIETHSADIKKEG